MSALVREGHCSKYSISFFGVAFLGRYRSRLDIIADLLRVVKGNARKTQILRQANLSYKLLQRYLAEVVALSFVYFDGETGFYKLTGKGLDFLDAYQRHSQFVKTTRSLGDKALSLERSLEEFCPKENG